MNIKDLVAIDIHTHAWKSALAVDTPTESQEAMGRYFRYQPQHTTVPEMAEYYRKLKMGFVVFTVDGEKGASRKITNEEIAELAHRHSDVAIPFASVNPHRGAEGVRMAKRLISDYNVKGFKFHPSVQGFYPNDRMAYPLYEAIAEAKLPALFHSGQTGVGAGTRGGGIRLKYSHPMLLDDVAVDFPDMPIIIAHPSFPWQEEALSVATHKPQVYIDLSGWSPKYFPPILVQYANTLLKDKMLFGSDYPVLSPERWMADFDTLKIKPEVRPLILKENAVRLLGLDKAA